MVSSLDLYVTSLCATDVFNLLDDKYLATKLLLFTFLTCIYIFTLSMLLTNILFRYLVAQDGVQAMTFCW